jgi:hypothetical protein
MEDIKWNVRSAHLIIARALNFAKSADFSLIWRVQAARQEYLLGEISVVNVALEFPP